MQIKEVHNITQMLVPSNIGQYIYSSPVQDHQA